MTTTYTWDVFTTLDGFGSYDVDAGDWGGYWGKQGPELLEHRDGLYADDAVIVLGANTFREFVAMVGIERGTETPDPWVARMRGKPTVVVSRHLEGPFDWPNATVAAGDAIDVVRDLKERSGVPLRSHGSLSLNRVLLAAGLVDEVQVTVFPAISGRSGTQPIFAGAEDFDLQLVDSRTLDGRVQELTYRPTRRS